MSALLKKIAARIQKTEEAEELTLGWDAWVEY